MSDMIPDSLKDKIYYEEPDIVLLHGDCLEILPQLELESIQCCVTSPPYWGLRDYGVDGQVGLEDSPEAYTERLSEVFRHINKILKPDGTLWLNLGDSYATNSGKVGKAPGGGQQGARWIDGKGPTTQPNRMPIKGLKSKDLVGIPWRVAFALQASGWYLRKDIIEEVEIYCPCGCGHIMEERIVRYSQDRVNIWHKPNPMPESVKDRPTTAHEYLFLMAKSEIYYYNAAAINEPAKDYGKRDRTNWSKKINAKEMGQRPHMGGEKCDFSESGKNKRSVWTIPIKPYKEAHFAVFPAELIEPCILAGSRAGDIIVDPFGGSQTTGEVCKKHGRRYIGIDINRDSLDLGIKRFQQEVLF